MELAQKTSRREVGIDALRILSMFMVVVSHIDGHGGVIAEASGVTYWLVWLLETFGYCSVDCFAAISGYVMVDKPIKPQRMTIMWAQVVFYSFFVTLFVHIAIPGSVGIKELVASLFPLFRRQYWYMSEYTILFLFLPVLNSATSRLTKKQFKLFLITIFAVSSASALWDIGFKNGYTAVWLMALFMLGAYIKKYVDKDRISIRTAALIYIACVLASWFWRALIEHKILPDLGSTISADLFTKSISATVVLMTIMAIAIFRQIEVRSQWLKKVIARVGPLAFGVYLIHETPAFSVKFVYGKFIFLTECSAVGTLLGILLCAAVIFAVCIAIDAVRDRLFRLLRVNEMCVIVTEWGVKKAEALAERL